MGCLRMELWKLFWQTTYVGKAVILLLIFFSIQSWYYIFLNYFRFRNYYQKLAQFNELLEREGEFEKVVKSIKSLRSEQLFYVIKKITAEFSEIYEFYFKKSIPIEDMRLRLELAEKELNEAMVLEKERFLSGIGKGLGFLATTGGVAPFIGLFGTVWGIMKAFHDIGLKGSASLATVAPGIAEALINTAMGLFCAIPAVIAYNHFLLTKEKYAKELELSLKKFYLILKKGFLTL